jgi:hypothetical protein
MAEQKKKEVSYKSPKLDKHFKLDKQTKRMMALGKFPSGVKLNAAEQREANVKLEPLTSTGFKNMMIGGILSIEESKMSGFNDPFYNPKKKKQQQQQDGVITTASVESGDVSGSSASPDLSPKKKVSLAPRKMKKEGGI